MTFDSEKIQSPPFIHLVTKVSVENLSGDYCPLRLSTDICSTVDLVCYCLVLGTGHYLQGVGGGVGAGAVRGGHIFTLTL